MSDLVLKAKGVMHFAHCGQTDKSDEPFHTHPERVAKAVAHLGEEYEAAAYLHDVVEDSAITLEDLALWFPPVVAEAVDALTHRGGEETYMEYVARAGRNTIAREVKIADMRDNLRPGGKESLYRRYRGGLKLLGAEE